MLRHEGDYWGECGETAQVSSQQVDYVDKMEKRSEARKEDKVVEAERKSLL